MLTSIRKIRVSPAAGKPDTSVGGTSKFTKISFNPVTITRTYWTTEDVCDNATGTDIQYTLLHTPNTPANTLLVYVNGVLQRMGVDFTINGNILIFSSVVETGRNIIAFYSYNA